MRNPLTPKATRHVAIYTGLALFSWVVYLFPHRLPLTMPEAVLPWLIFAVLVAWQDVRTRHA